MARDAGVSGPAFRQPGGSSTCGDCKVGSRSGILAHAAAIALLYLVFSFALYMGLQVEPLYGNIGLALAAMLLAAYVYFRFVRRRK